MRLWACVCVCACAAVICNDFPAHSHWTLSGSEDPTPIATPTVHISWGKYGEYELVLSADGQTMTGSAKGSPNNWRKAKRTRALDQGVAEAHVHDH